MDAAPVRCPACGHLNPAGSRFCNACGARVAPPDQPAPPPAPAAPAAAPAAAQQAAPPAEEEELQPGAPIDPAGRYVVERAIAKGGFGEAYLVRDRQLRRYAVAKRHSPNPAWSPRTRELAGQNFRREAQLLVTLNAPGHPHIPEIYEFLPDQGFLVMKYVEGRDLSQILRDQGGRLPAAIALPIVRDVCSALAYMHSKRPEPVLHRDVKPGNIIIDSAGRVWLIDFGLSRAAPMQPGADPRHTQLAGTIGFTPPEQWRGKAEPRSDIFALAVTLHQLLTGFQPPLTRDDLPEFLKGLRNPFPPVRSLDPAIRPDVEALVARGLAFRPEERPTAQDLLAALDKIIAPTARADLQAPDGATLADEHALALWAERRWEQAAAWLYGALPEQVATLWGRNKLAGDMRQIVARNAGDHLAGLDELLAALDPGGFGAATPRLVADRRSIDYGELGVDDRRDEWLQLSNTGRRYIRVDLQAPRWVIPASSSLSLPPGRQQRLKLTADMRRVPDGGKLKDGLLLRDRTGAGFRIELTAKLSRWKTFWARGVVGQRMFDWEAGAVRQVRQIAGHRGGVWGLDFSPDGRQLASGGWDGAVRLWRTADGTAVGTLEERGGNVLSVAFSPDGVSVAATGSSEVVTLWQPRTGKLLRTIGGHHGYLSSLAFSPDSELLITSGGDKTVCVWQAADGALVERFTPAGGALTVAPSPSGRELAVGCGDRRIRIYSARGALLQVLEGHRDGPSSLAYSGDGSLLASAAGDNTVLVWDAASGALRHTLKGHQNTVRSLAVHPDGLVVASGSVDGEIRLWRTADGALRQVIAGHGSGVLRLVFARNGDALASSAGDGAIALWQPAN
jgi:WD40 repeat protein/tRNA A-37 threonylcarbamoyl transferase component Bud32